jgi:uncharacterized membrane protein YphA (DoxX/SURF4 family)
LQKAITLLLGQLPPTPFFISRILPKHFHRATYNGIRRLVICALDIFRVYRSAYVARYTKHMATTMKLADDKKLALASILIRTGLAIVFLYAAISALRTPEAWIGYVPPFTAHIMPLHTILDVLSISQIILAVWLLSGWFIKYAAAGAIALLAGIVAFNLGSLIVTFRDVGILFAALALIILDW